MVKYTASWWGRVAELIFAKYHSRAQDMVVKYGNSSPYDFEDPTLGRIDVRGSLTDNFRFGNPSWVFPTYGLNKTCDHGFFVGFNRERDRVMHLWLIPSSEIPDAAITFTPSSAEYHWSKREVTERWGVALANDLLRNLHELPNLVKPSDHLAWIDDPSQFSNPKAPGSIGRLGELLYKGRYPTSRDMNRDFGPSASYDFEDADGVRVDVKTSWPLQRSENSVKWSFGRGHRGYDEHSCDVYSCLCLDWEGEKLLAEYRVPSEQWGTRRTIHIYENGREWSEFRVPR
jgi:hypothetical protein